MGHGLSGRFAAAAAEGLGHGAIIVLDALTDGMIDELHAEAHRLIAENGALYEYSRVAGSISREALMQAIGGKVFQLGGKAAATLLQKAVQKGVMSAAEACQMARAANIAGTVVGIEAKLQQAEATARHVQAAREAFDRGDHVTAARELGQAGLSFVNTAAGIKSALDTAQRGFGGCFAAGTPLLTPDGWKAVEDFQVGDQLLSRPEALPGAANEIKTVEGVFVRSHLVVDLPSTARSSRRRASILSTCRAAAGCLAWS